MNRPSILVTGIAGNLGQRLLLQMADFSVVGVDIKSPAMRSHLRFEHIDLGEESSCRRITELLRELRIATVVHLAFVLDPLRSGILDESRMWQINVAGTARVMEAIAEVNRMGGAIRKFIHLSSVSAYGPDLPQPAREDHALRGHTLAYARHKRDADLVVQSRAAGLGECGIYLLRPHIFAGTTMHNYMIGALRGNPGGNGWLAAYFRRNNKRLPLLLPSRKKSTHNKLQFVHVDDVARLITHILHLPDKGEHLTILNVAGRGPSLLIADCARISGQKIVCLPGRAAVAIALKAAWSAGLSDVPPDALPYIIGSYTMDTRRLQRFLGEKYDTVIRFTSEEALADSFADHTGQIEAAKAG